MKIIFKRTHIQATEDVGLNLSLVKLESGSVGGLETNVEIQKRMILMRGNSEEEDL